MTERAPITNIDFIASTYDMTSCQVAILIFFKKSKCFHIDILAIQMQGFLMVLYAFAALDFVQLMWTNMCSIPNSFIANTFNSPI